MYFGEHFSVEDRINVSGKIMRFFKKFDGIFTVNDAKYSNAVLKLSEREMYNFLSEKAGKSMVTIDGVELRLWGCLNNHQKAVLHRLMPNDTSYWEDAVIISYDLHVWADGSETIRYHDEGEERSGYVGYLCSTRYADGSMDGTYWNQYVVVPAKTRAEAIELLERAWNK